MFFLPDRGQYAYFLPDRGQYAFFLPDRGQYAFFLLLDRSRYAKKNCLPVANMLIFSGDRG